MADLINVAKIDLDTLSAFQRMLHHPADEEEEIDSHFSFQFKKTAWSTNLVEKLKIDSSDENVTFTANHKFDFLMYTYIVQKLPALRVLENYRKTVEIAWPHNVNHNTLIEGSLRFDDDPAQKFSSVWLDIHSQFYMKPGFRDHHNIMAGNVPFLEDWTDFLPAFPVITPQPWYYARHDAVAVPLFLCSLSRVTHTYKIRSRISDILRMRVRESSKSRVWTEIAYNYNYLEGVTEQEAIPKPEMWGRYALVTDAEREWRKSTPHEVYSEDVIEITHENTSRFTSTIPIALHSDTPTKAIHWVAENVDATEMNNRSNYTTNTADYFKGWNPVKTPQLSYGGVARIPKMEHHHFDRVEPWYKFPSPPSEPGYNGYSIGYDPTSLHADIGVVLNGLNARFTCTLGNTDPFLSKVIDRRRHDVHGKDGLVPEEIARSESSSSRDSPNFRIHVLLLVTRKLVFELGEKVHIVEGTPIQQSLDTPHTQ